MTSQPETCRRVLIVGGVAGGASCAARLRRMDEFAEIVLFEKGPYVSFANCGLPYHVGGVIEEEAKLLVAKPAMFRGRFRIDVRVNTEVTAIDREAKTARWINHETGEEGTDPYTHLVLSPGAVPIRPPIPGLDREGVFTIRTVPDAREVKQWITDHGARRAVVVGGGYIGLEMLENLHHLGLECTLVERLDQVMPPVDKEMVQEVQDHIRQKGVDLRLSEEVVEVAEGTESKLLVKAKSGAEFPADIVVLSVGVRPLSELAKAADLEIGDRGGISVDDHMRTSDPDIYAVGDAVEVVDVVTGAIGPIPLAGPANRQGRIAADNIAGRDETFRGAQATAVCGCFDLTIACTGASEKALRLAEMEYEKVTLFPAHHVGYYPGAEAISFKVLFNPTDGRILGAQAVGRAGVEKRVDVVATIIQFEGTVFDMEEVELCYAPQYGAAKDPVNMAGFIAANHVRGDSPLVHWDTYLRGGADGALVLDVREQAEWDRGHIEGALLMPLDTVRDRLDELPRDRPVWVHCAAGQRSYYAVRVLRQHGFDARNLSGGYRHYRSVEAAARA